MHFKDGDQGSGRNRPVPGVRGQGRARPTFTVLILLFMTVLWLVNNSHAELIERVVAVVNNEIILLSELQAAVEKSKAVGTEKSRDEVLQELINHTLFLEQALKFRAEMQTYHQDEERERKLIDDYINRRIKTFINIPFEEIENYYGTHREDFGGRDLYEVWDEIESRLRTERLQGKINEHILQLRKDAYIRIQINPE